MQDEIEKILEERGRIYGDAVDTHEEIGKIWSIIISRYNDIPLSLEIPPHIVALCMASLKIVRASKQSGESHTDSFDDMEGYIRIARKSVQRTCQECGVEEGIPHKDKCPNKTKSWGKYRCGSCGVEHILHSSMSHFIKHNEYEEYICDECFKKENKKPLPGDDGYEGTVGREVSCDSCKKYYSPGERENEWIEEDVCEGTSLFFCPECTDKNKAGVCRECGKWFSKGHTNQTTCHRCWHEIEPNGNCQECGAIEGNPHRPKCPEFRKTKLPGYVECRECGEMVDIHEGAPVHECREEISEEDYECGDPDYKYDDDLEVVGCEHCKKLTAEPFELEWDDGFKQTVCKRCYKSAREEPAPVPDEDHGYYRAPNLLPEKG